MQFLTFLKDPIGFVSDSRVSFFVVSLVLFFSNQKAPGITCTAIRFQSFGNLNSPANYLNSSILLRLISHLDKTNGRHFLIT